MIEAKEANMNDIIKEKIENKSCYFIGRIVRIQNKENPWFEKCTSCNERLYPLDSEVTTSCQTCENDRSTFIRKFMLRLTISYGDDETCATMFDASEYLIGCSVT